MDMDSTYNVYFDIKDTCSQRKLHKLAEILKYNSAIRDFNFVKSHQVHFIQMADILMGAINYHLRIQRGTIEGKVRAKRLIVEKIKKQTNLSLLCTTPLKNKKFYLFFINSVFIALATYAMVRFLKYEKKAFIDKVRERNVKRLMMVITLVTFIPSVVIGFHMVRVSLFEAVADKYVSQVFNFPHTRVIECNKHYAQGKNPSQIELLLVGEPLGEVVIENACSQMRNFGLEEAELVVRQAITEDKVDVVSLQKSYQELLEEKNRRIGEMSSQLKRYRVTNVEVNDISREVGAMMDNIGAISLTKGITFDVEGTPGDTTLVCVVAARDAALPVDRETLIRWLRIRTKVENVKLFVEP